MTLAEKINVSRQVVTKWENEGGNTRKFQFKTIS